MPLATLVAAASLALAASAQAEDPTTAARVVVCPAAPAGWTLPHGENGRFVLAPTSSLNENPGATSVQVTCKYFNNKNGQLLGVAVRYALPTNLNPYNDFAIGCSSTIGSVPWDTKNRVYRVASTSAWAFATFDDNTKLLGQAEVGEFELIAQALVKSAQPVAHDCSATAATGQTVWSFGFDADVKYKGLETVGGTTGTFITVPYNGQLALGQLKARAIVLKITRAAKPVGTVTIVVTTPVSFAFQSHITLKALVEVKSSTYAPCHAGQKGDLTVSVTSRKAILNVCNRNLLQGSGLTFPTIENR